MYNKFEMPKVIPLNAQWDITSGCNFRCVFCLTSSGTITKGELTTKEVYSLLDKLHRAGILFLTILGGEPFFRKDIIDIFKYAAKKGMLISFSTNCSLVEEKHAQELYDMRNSFQYIQMSLYGYNEETYERITGSAKNYQLAMKGVKNLVDAGLNVTALVVATPDNIEKISKYYDLAVKLGVKGFRLTPISDLGRANISYRGKTEYFSSIYPLLIDQLLDLKKLASSVSPHILIDARPLLGEYIKKETNFETYFQNCKAGTTSIYINSTGKAAPCPFFDHSSQKLRDIYSDLELDDIKNKKFEEVWYNDTFRSLRSYFDPDKNKFKINTKCKFFKNKKCIPCATTPCHCLYEIKSSIKYQDECRC